jgi:hypothetical protein
MHTADQLRGCHGRSAFRRNRRIIAWLGGHSALQDLDNLRTVLVSFASVWWCGFLRAASILHRLVGLSVAVRKWLWHKVRDRLPARGELRDVVDHVGGAMILI